MLVNGAGLFVDNEVSMLIRQTEERVVQQFRACNSDEKRKRVVSGMSML